MTMNSAAYYTQRLLPFLLVYIIYEFLEISILRLSGIGGESSGTLLLNILHLSGEIGVAFLFLILPYLLYILVLPAAFHGGRSDRLVSSIFFAVFCIISAAEELTEVLSGESFHLLTVQILQEPKAGFNALLHSPHAAAYSITALLLVIGSSLLFRRKLCPPLGSPVPQLGARLLAPCLAVAAAFILDGAQVKLSLNHGVPELYQEGIFSLFDDLFAFTAFPDLGQIFGPPCLFISLLGLGFYVLNCSIAVYIGPEKSPARLLRRGYDYLSSRYGSDKVRLSALLLFLLLLRLISLGIYPLMDTTEARYAEMARKMVETGNWLQPQFDYGVPFWGKPPLSFQCSALCMKIFGVNEFAARLAPFLACLGICSLFFAWTFRNKSFEQASACSIIFFSSAIGFVSAGAVMTDAFLCLGCALAMHGFWRGIQGESLLGYLFFAGLAIGMLSKGPLCLVLCGGSIALWLLLSPRQRLPLLRRLPWLGGTLLFLALSLPWYIAAEQATPGFLRYFIIGEHFERFLVKGWQGDLYGAGHSRALGSIWLYAVEMFLPWVLLLPFLLVRSKRKPEADDASTADNTAAAAPAEGERSYLWAWALTPLIFFSAARNILPAYVLPSLPAACLLLQGRLQELAATRHKACLRLVFGPAPLLLILLLFACGNGFQHIQYRCQKENLSHCEAGAPLYCLTVEGKRSACPYSAQFYSGGKLRIITDIRQPIPRGAYLLIPYNATPPAKLPEGLETVCENRNGKVYRQR